MPSSPNDIPSRGVLRWQHIERVAYRDALDMQMQCWEERRDSRRPDHLFTLEHHPVITLGRRAKDEDVLLSPEALQQRGIDLVRIDRGGEATWHGPGQLVLYPIIHVGQHEIGVSDLVRGLSACIRDFLADLGIESEWSNEHPGIWVEDRKIAAVGMRIQSGVSRHGAALNLSSALDAYSAIVPCGMPGGKVTSVLQELGHTPSLPTAAEAIAQLFAARFGFSLERVAAD